jgi:hypothetical protein
VSVDSVLDDRFARWATDLYDWGYVQEDPVWPAGTAAIAIRARWPLGAPEIVITVHEIWLPGSDPDGLGLTGHGCYLFYAGWHAQFPSPPGELGSERLDVDRRKPKPQIVHRHLFGKPNDIRLPEPSLPSPEAWLLRVAEQIS